MTHRGQQIRRTALIMIATLALTACGTGSDKPEPTPEPTRWGLDEVLPHAKRVPNTAQRVAHEGDWDPRTCYGFAEQLTLANGSFGSRFFNESQEYGRYVDGDTTIDYMVLWSNYLRDNIINISTELIGKLDKCATDPADVEYRDLIGYPTFTRSGSVESGRFGWHESTVKPAGWQEHGTAHLNENDLKYVESDTAKGPYQAIGEYTFVNDWLIVGIEIKTTNTTIDLTKESKIDELLNHLTAKVKADPITHYDFDHRNDYP